MLTGVTPQWLHGMFGRIARRYDMTNTVLSAGLDAYWRRRLARRVAAGPAYDILDVACGTGRVMLQVARRCASARRIVGADFTEAMVRVGRRRLVCMPRWSHLHLCVADALSLPYPAHRFDVVTMMFGVRNFVDPGQGLSECYRVLRAGGRLCVVEFAWPQGRWLRWLYGGYWHYLLPLLAWPLSGERAAYRYLRDSVLDFRQQVSLPALLRQVGFVAVQTWPLSGGIVALYEAVKPAGE
jgi:demethylmenaquinone methyltransferase/2-methoxy-6-polyprenyl-1,4-benzoquinol methylase